jgi:organic hydroperoxide reductase OsmC/OhrA
MNDNKEKHFPFQVDLRWISGQTGIVTANDAEGSIQVSVPPVFGGEGKPWTPEHLFLGSISSCFMTTYMSFAKKFKFEVNDFNCEAKGGISLVEGKLVFTGIDVYSKIKIASSEFSEKASLAFDKTKKYCIISNSILTPINYHFELMVDGQTGIIADMNINKTA